MADARLNVILSLTDRFSTNLKSVNRTLAQNQDLLKKVSLAASAFSIASVLAIRSFARAAIDSKQAQASLEAAIAGAGKTFKEFEGPIDKAISSLTKFSNYSKDEFKRALGDMIIVLGEVPLAIAALGVTADVAARTGTDLGDAALQVSKFMKGETDSIRGLTGSIGKDITNPLERLAWLQEKVAGSALANIDPFKRLGNQINDTKAVIGKFIVDDLEPLLKKFGELLGLIERVPPGVLEFGSKVVIIGAGFATLVAALAGMGLAWTLALPALTALGAWVISPVGLALLALAVAIGVAADSWPKFVEEMDKARKKMEEPLPETPAQKGGFWSTDWWGPFVTWYETSWPKWLKDWDGFVAGWKTFFGMKWELSLPKWLTEPITLPEINFTESWNKFWGGTWFTITLPDWLFKPIKIPDIEWPELSWKAWDDFWATHKLPELKLSEIKWPKIELPEITWGDILNTLKIAWKAFLDGLETTRGIAAIILKAAWDAFWPTLKGAIDILKANVDPAWKAFWDGLGAILKLAANVIIGLAEGMANGVIAAVNAMINALNRIQVPDWLPGIGGKGINIPLVAGVTIPRLAEGGIVTTPTLAMIGERGPEAVIPLRGQRGGGLTINFYGPTYGMDDFRKKVAQAVRDSALAGGFYGLKIGSNA